MSDFKNFTTNATSPSLDAFTITPSASPLAKIPRAIVADVGGSVTVTTYKGTSLSFVLTAGIPLPLVVTHVTAATATGLKGLE